MKKSLALLAICGWVILTGCNMSPDEDKGIEVSILPVLVGGTGGIAVRSVSQPAFGGNTGYALNGYLLFAPVISGFSTNTSGVAVGDNYSTTCLDSTVTFAISESAGVIKYAGTFTDGSGWVNTWYDAANNQFWFEQLIYFDDSEGNLSGDGRLYVLYKKSDKITFGSDFNHFFGKMTVLTYARYPTSGPDSDGTAPDNLAMEGSSNSYFLYGGDLSTATHGIGVIKLSNGLVDGSVPPGAVYDIGSITNTPAQNLTQFGLVMSGLQTYLQGVEVANRTVAETCDGSAVTGFAYDPAVLPNFIELNKWESGNDWSATNSTTGISATECETGLDSVNVSGSWFDAINAMNAVSW